MSTDRHTHCPSAVVALRRHRATMGRLVRAAGLAGGVASCGDAPTVPGFPADSRCLSASAVEGAVSGLTFEDVESAVRHAADVLAPAVAPADRELSQRLEALIGLRHVTRDEACRRVVAVEQSLSRFTDDAHAADREAILHVVELAVVVARVGE